MSICRLLVVAMSLMVATINVASGQINVGNSVEYDFDKYSISGKKVLLTSIYGIKVDCSLMDWMDASVTKQPEHGKVTIIDKKTSVFFAKDNSKSACNGKTVMGKIVEYASSSDYKGDDVVVVEAVTSEGGRGIYTFRIKVK